MIDLRTRQGWDDLKRVLDDRMEEVLRRLGLPEPKGNGTITMSDPRGDDKNPSFVIWTRKPGGLSWKRLGTPLAGRTLELIAHCKGWYHLERRGAMEAARWAIAELGLDSIDPAQLASDRARAAEAATRARQDGAAELRRKQTAAFHTFTNARPILDTLAEAYLREARGIDLRAAPFIGPRGGSLAPKALRFIPHHKYVHRNRDGSKSGESFHPCMIACCVDAQMQIRAIHQTWLRRDGSDKAELPPAPDGCPQKPRKVFPDFSGLVIPLWRGAEQLTVSQAQANFEENGVVETLCETEGNEDGLSAVIAAPQNRTWAVISLGNFANVARRLPAFVDSVIIHRQNDWQKPEAVAEFDRGMAAHRATGRMVAEVGATTGKDLNDTLRGIA